MISKIKETISKYNMINRGDKVYVAVSGGADSVCLLLVLQEIRNELGCEIEAIHVEHGIRGDDSVRDKEFVENLCKSLDILLHVYSVDSLSYSKSKGLSLEEAARELRYECFSRHTKEGKIAIAHHSEDNAETMIFNMVRGSGIEGIRGIKKVRGNFIRPLIECSKKEIIDYLLCRNQPYCIDKTNEDTDYTRNSIRHNIIPRLKEINPRAIEHLSNLSRIQDMAVDFIDKNVTTSYGKYVKDNKVSKELLSEELIIVNQVIHRLICNMAGSKKDISYIHVEQVIDLMKGTSGRKVHLPYNLVAISNYGDTEIKKCDSNNKSEEKTELYKEIKELEETGKAVIEVNNITIELEIVTASKNVQIDSKNYTKMLDYDKITEVLSVRNRREKDYIVINEKGSKKGLNRYMIDEKIPSQNRDDMLLLCDGSHIMYVFGHRISEYYKVSGNTRRILKVHVTGEGINE